MWAILSVLVENKPGVLFKITNLFRSKNFNIDSISVGVTENPEFSKMTITTIGDEKRVAQIIKQLNKLIDTVEVKRLDEKMTVYRELVLMKIKASKPSEITEIMNLANAFECKIHDVRQSSKIVRPGGRGPYEAGRTRSGRLAGSLRTGHPRLGPPRRPGSHAHR